MPALQSDLENKHYQRREVLTTNSDDALVKNIFQHDSSIEEIWTYRDDRAPRKWWTAIAIYPGVTEPVSGSIEDGREAALKSLEKEVKKRNE